MSGVTPFNTQGGYPFLPNGHGSPTTILDLTDVVEMGEGALVYGVHSDIKEAKVVGHTCCAKILRFLGDYSDSNALWAFRERGVKEMVIWARLHHPNVLPLLGYALGLGPSLALISPYIHGGAAPTYLRKYPTTDRVALASGIAEGLAYFHQHRIVHGDVKGVNILISVTGSHITPLICDFGSAHVAGTEGMVAGSSGTYRWMARELLRFGLDQEDDTPAAPTVESDVWSFGMTVLELFTDDVPFHELKTCTQAVFHIQSGGLPSYPGSPARERGLTPALWKLLRTCWATDPAARPTSSTLVARLDELQLAG